MTCSLICFACATVPAKSNSTPTGKTSTKDNNAIHCGSTQAVPFELNDQFNKPRSVKFPREKITVLMFANRKSALQGRRWGTVLWNRYGNRIVMEGVGVGNSVSKWQQGVIRFLIRQATDIPIMLDWDGKIGRRYAFEGAALNVVVIDVDGTISFKLVGKATKENCATVYTAIDSLLGKIF